MLDLPVSAHAHIVGFLSGIQVYFPSLLQLGIIYGFDESFYTFAQEVYLISGDKFKRLFCIIQFTRLFEKEFRSFEVSRSTSIGKSRFLRNKIECQFCSAHRSFNKDLRFCTVSTIIAL